jgi:selenocysteine-specific elongation factor
VEAAVAALLRGGQAQDRGAWLLESAWWKRLQQRAAGVIDEYHRTHPQETGMALPQLDSVLRGECPVREAFELLVKALVASGFETSGDRLHRRGHRPVLPESMTDAAARLRRQLAARPLDPPGLKELLTAPGDERALRFLIEQGEVVRLDAQTAIAASAYREFAGQVKRFLGERGQATASEIRQATGTTRRVLIPLLERLDADRITMRRGDARSLRPGDG